MKVLNVLNCSFPHWYHSFESVTVESIIIPLPDEFIKYLHTDGIVLPERSNHGIYKNFRNLAMDGDDNDEDLRDDKLMKMYEADWSSTSSTETAEAPDFGEFDETVKAAIKSLGGRVFPKLNWSSPKDASWIAFDKTLMCTCPSDVYLLLKSSEFIAHDLDQPFVHCDDNQLGSTPVAYTLVLRKWHPADPSTEFRCFVYHNRVIGVCQRNSTKFYAHIVQAKEEILEDVLTFFNQEISHKFPDAHYIFDVVRPKQGKVILIDFNPWGVVTDTLLYTWEELNEMATQSFNHCTEQLPNIKCIESEDGLQSSDYANYAFPRDIRDLAAGEDPYKLMDLLKMNNDNDSSSSDDEVDVTNSDQDTVKHDKPSNSTAISKDR